MLPPEETAEEIAVWKPQVPAGAYALEAVVICDEPGPLRPQAVAIRIGPAQAPPGP